MKPFPLNLKHFKKIKVDQHSSVLKHKDGHEIRIAHASLKPELRKQLDELPHYADGTPGGPIGSSDDDRVVHIDPSTLPGYQAPAQPMSNPEFQVSDQNAPQAQAQPQAAPKASLSPFNSPLMMNVEAQKQALLESKRGQQMQAAALGQQGSETQKYLTQFETQKEREQQYYEAANQVLLNERREITDRINKGQLNPERYLQNMSTWPQVKTSIGLILGGIGAGLTGTPNLAYDMLRSHISNDIEAQKAELGKQQNLLSHNLQATGDLRSATDLTRMNMNDIMAAHLKGLAGQAMNLQAKGQMLDLAGKYNLENAQIQHQLALQGMALGTGATGAPQKPGELNQYDPAGFVSSMVPKEHQAQVFKEIDAAQDTRRMAKSIMDSFDKAAEENTVFKTGAGLLRTPASVYALHQAMQPTFKDLEGTVRQAAMDNTFKNITPQPGDKDYTVETKRQALLDYLQSKASASTAKGYGIDLHRFESTAPFTEQKHSLEGQQGFFPGIGRVVMRNGKVVKAQ
jgi:hypothetical protein